MVEALPGASQTKDAGIFMNEIRGKKEAPQQPYALEDELTIHWLRATQSRHTSRKSLTRTSNPLSWLISKILALIQ
jgi:hypothetical protein